MHVPPVYVAHRAGTGRVVDGERAGLDAVLLVGGGSLAGVQHVGWAVAQMVYCMSIMAAASTADWGCNEADQLINLHNIFPLKT